MAVAVQAKKCSRALARPLIRRRLYGKKLRELLGLNKPRFKVVRFCTDSVCPVKISPAYASCRFHPPTRSVKCPSTVRSRGWCLTAWLQSVTTSRSERWSDGTQLLVSNSQNRSMSESAVSRSQCARSVGRRQRAAGGEPSQPEPGRSAVPAPRPARAIQQIQARTLNRPPGATSPARAEGHRATKQDRRGVRVRSEPTSAGPRENNMLTSPAINRASGLNQGARGRDRRHRRQDRRSSATHRRSPRRHQAARRRARRNPGTARPF